MKRRVLVSQGTLARILAAAEHARNRRDFQQSIDLLERANRLDPANVNVLLNLGHAHGLHYDYPAAEQCFERAFRISSKKAEAMAGAGLRARDFGNYKLAEHYYRLASEQKEVAPETLVSLAEIYERLSRLEDAAQLIDQSLNLSPNLPSALIVRARLQRQTGKLEEAEKLLRTFPPNAPQDLRARSLYELGGILDRQGSYDEAMAMFQEAKSLLKLDAGRAIQERQIMRHRLKLLSESLTPEMLKRWFDVGAVFPSAYRLAFLCGHPRSGTTLLEQVLDSHPDAISAEETDIFHDQAYLPLQWNFPEDAPLASFLESAETAALLKSRQGYMHAIEAFLGIPLAGRLLVDKNPSLTYLIAAIVRIFPESKFVVAIRDPRDVCLSCFMQPFVPVAPTSSAYLTLESTVEEYIELMTMHRTLARQMTNPCIELRYEDLVENLETVSRRVVDFLGLTWDDRVLKFDEHARQKVVRSPTYADVKQPVFKRAVGRWHHYEKYLAPHLKNLKPFIETFGYAA